ncbi:MAG: heavy-metal-associated domain-containing protein [Sphingobacteriales bacterium]|nr:MAG: heavy-metal-associated domain-containing protein [Sphingobacteriales bacterium]
MTHTYAISGMTCSGCQAKVKTLLEGVDAVQQVSIDLEQGTAAIQMQHHIATPVLQEALKDYPKYQLTASTAAVQAATGAIEPTASWFVTYKPIVLVFGYILAVTLAVEAYHGAFRPAEWMNNFMAAFFLVFSFFKMLNLKGFAESYLSYDIIARRWMGWGYVYAFVELLLGLAFLLRFHPLLTNAVTLVVMGISIIGVMQSVLQQRKMKCACLGAVFNLPMSTVTIIEDSLMIAMSLAMLAMYL